MAYAEVAGLPPVVGLWAVLVSLLVYAVFGSSRQLSVGPESTTALLTATVVAPLAAGDPAAMRPWPRRSRWWSARCACWPGLLRLGFVADLLSKPVLVGYMAGVGGADDRRPTGQDDRRTGRGRHRRVAAGVVRARAARDARSDRAAVVGGARAAVRSERTASRARRCRWSSWCWPRSSPWSARPAGGRRPGGRRRGRGAAAAGRSRRVGSRSRSAAAARRRRRGRRHTRTTF